MSLRETLASIKAGAVERIPPEAREIMNRVTRDLEASGQAERSLGVGTPIPRFALKNHEEIVTSSADLVERAPLVVLFYRGVW